MTHSVLLPCQSRGLNSHSQVCQIAPVPTEPSRQTIFYHSLFKLLKCKCLLHIKAGRNPHSLQTTAPAIGTMRLSSTARYALPMNPGPVLNIHFHSHRHAAPWILTFLCVHVLYPCWEHLPIYPFHIYLSSLEAEANAIPEENTHSKLYNKEALGMPVSILAQSEYKSKTNGQDISSF